MIARVSGGAPNACDAKLTTATFSVVIRTINFSPGMAAAYRDAPTMCLGVFKGLLDFLAGVWLSSHIGLHYEFDRLRLSSDILGPRMNP